MPSTSLQARRTKKAPRKNVNAVKAAIASSALGRYHGFVARESNIPNVERPSARRMMLSKCSSAAVVAGVADSTESAVAVDSIGDGRWVARNM